MKKDNNMVIEEAKKRFQTIMEYVVSQGTVVEADEETEEPQEEMGGEMDPNMGNDPAAMGGEMDPNMGNDPAAMGGEMDPNMGNDPAAMGGGEMDPNMGGPEGFSPQDMTLDGGMGQSTDGVTEPMQDGDEVIDVDDLTDAQEETEAEVSKINDKFDKVLKAIGAFEELLRSNDEKIEGLKSEFEKRNPTQVEKLSMQTAKSYPFNVKPEEFWAEKEATSNYSTEDDQNGVKQGQYVITAKDIAGETNWKEIADSLDDDDFMYNQTLNKILSL
jgi:hypothetical protein